jgi:hypothetical protein
MRLRPGGDRLPAPVIKPGRDVPLEKGKGITVPPEARPGGKAGVVLFPNPSETVNREGLKQLALSLGLPRDTLSTALLSFARYFSLPLDPELLFKLRRNVLSLMETRTLRASSSKTFRDALALALAAAADKGVELSPETLEHYADAIDPGGVQPEGREPPPRDRGGNRKPQDEPTEDDAPTPENIQKKAARIEANKPFLGILNMIPGKDGLRWIVLPFVFLSGGVEFRVSIRILLKEGNTSENKVERLAVDVSSENRRWLFSIDQAGTPEARADISIYPPLETTSLAVLEREIRGLLEEFAGEIRLWNHKEAPPFGEDSRNEVLFSINEEV